MMLLIILPNVSLVLLDFVFTTREITFLMIVKEEEKEESSGSGGTTNYW
jgi:hypothetical protein